MGGAPPPPRGFATAGAKKGEFSPFFGPFLGPFSADFRPFSGVRGGLRGGPGGPPGPPGHPPRRPPGGPPGPPGDPPRGPPAPRKCRRKSGRPGPTMAGGARRAPHPRGSEPRTGGEGAPPLPHPTARAWGRVSAVESADRSGVGDRNRSTADGMSTGRHVSRTESGELSGSCRDVRGEKIFFFSGKIFFSHEKIFFSP